MLCNPVLKKLAYKFTISEGDVLSKFSSYVCTKNVDSMVVQTVKTAN